MPSQRVQRTLERLDQDENLLADLDDRSAGALRGWIVQQLRAADDAPAEAYERRAAAIRRAVRSAAKANVADPVAAAQSALVAGAQVAEQPVSRSRTDAFAAAAARLLAPAEATEPSPAAALLPPSPVPSPAKRAVHGQRRRYPGWRYRKAR